MSNIWREAAAAVCLPRPRLTVSEWADRYRVIAQGTSPEPGPWRTERVPYLRGIMDALVDPAIETVVVMLASQLGKSESCLNILGYFVDQDPAPVLVVHPTIEAMEAFSKERIDPMFRATTALQGKLDSGLGDRGNSRKASNTIRVKHFPGGYLAMTGANAPAGLAARPIRVVLCDEVDRFPESAGTEGDPVKLARQRTSNFHNRKIVLVSTPTIDGLSKIQHWHGQGDQRQYLVPCPHCGVRQVLRWERTCYKNAAGERDFEHVHYLCGACERPIEERHKPAMLAAGEWVAQQPGGHVASFGDLSALCSPWVKWSTLAEEWCKAQDDKDRRGLQEFVNLRLGQPWVEHQQTIAVEYLERRREYYGPTLPAGIVLLTAGVDVQDNRLEAEILGWGPGKESWGVQYLRLMGDPTQPSVWQLLDSHLTATWQTADGRRLVVACVAVDSGGHCTSEVYDFCRAREARRVFAIKGQGGQGTPLIGKPSRNNRQRAVLFHIGVDDAKGTVFSRLLLDHEGAGYCHFPREGPRNYDADYFKGLLSEKRVVVQRAGLKKVEWKKTADRNEPLDCRVYATAALEILSPNLETLAGSAGRGEPKRPAPAPGGRRILSRGVS
ncbi:MAG: phage terminase large subunit family protein [Myxococcota bacterium]|jgi:phage terminase large subunit GpA-like protein|nr:phage terminase large subunit family protein [Myxococcota bacterium]